MRILGVVALVASLGSTPRSAGAFAPPAAPRLLSRPAASAPPAGFRRGLDLGPLRPFAPPTAYAGGVVRSGESTFRLASAAAAPPQKGAATLQKSKRLIAALSFLTGWADLALITKYKTFATMMTGNTMWMASAVVDGRYRDVTYYASAISSYILGLIVFRRSDLSLKDKSLSRVCAPLVAGLFCLADYLSWINPAERLIPVSLLSMGFAIINSVGSEVGGALTFVLTGHMTKLTALGVDRVSRKAGRKRPTGGDTSAAARSSLIIGSFFAGALWASALFAAAPQVLRRGAFSAMGIMYGAVFLWQDRANLGAWWLRDNEEMCEIDSMETTCT